MSIPRMLHAFFLSVGIIGMDAVCVGDEPTPETLGEALPMDGEDVVSDGIVDGPMVTSDGAIIEMPGNPLDVLGMKAHWKHGLEIETEDERFRVHVGGAHSVRRGMA